MIRQTLKYGTGLIALYIVVANASKMGTVIKAGSSGAIGLTKTLQGR